MEALIVFGGLFALVIIINIIAWFAELIENTKLASQFSSDLQALDSRLNRINISAMGDEFHKVHNHTRESMGRLVVSDGKTINSCPRCGAPVRVSPSYKGIHISCTKQGCYGSEHLETTDEGFAQIKTT